jgi:hypothetical protein
MRYKMKVVNPDKNIVSLRPTAGMYVIGLLTAAAPSVLAWIALKRLESASDDLDDDLDVPEFMDEKS